MLEWRDDHGFLEVAPRDYDEEYFEKYVGYANTDMGRELTNARLHLVMKHISNDAELLDVGVGCGRFIQAAHWAGLRVKGFDVGPPMVKWLMENGFFAEPWTGHVNATFWDSYEHDAEPWRYVENLYGHVFISIPIFRDKKHALISKHYRPDEHYWYFTREGLIRHFFELGFELIEENRMEEDLGREDIGTFVFRRKA